MKNNSTFYILRSTFSQAGQVAIIILLISIIGLTMGLSIASRSLSNLKETATTEESDRAFSAAEAGIEEALQIIKESPQATPAATHSFTEAGSEFDYSTEAVGSTSYAVDDIEQDNVIEVKLDGGSATNLNVYWTQPGSTTSLIMTFVTLNGSDYGMQKQAVNCGTDPGNGFGSASVVSYTKEGVTYTCLKSLSVPSGAKVLRLQTMYSAANILVEPLAGSLPNQSYKIVSSGKAGETQRTLEVIQSFPALPVIFDYVLFSGSQSDSLSK